MEKWIFCEKNPAGKKETDEVFLQIKNIFDEIVKQHENDFAMMEEKANRLLQANFSAVSKNKKLSKKKKSIFRR